jgi:hypothetical protein
MSENGHLILVPDSNCLYCGAVLNFVSSATPDARTPLPGDITVCFSCTRPMEFDADLLPIALVPDSPIPPQLFRVIQLMQEFKMQRLVEALTGVKEEK